MESIPLPQYEWYVLPGFRTFEEAQQKVQLLMGKTGSITYEIQQQPDSFAIVFPGAAVPFLNETERATLGKIKRIRSDVIHPTVWRFIDREYVERFFETGELRITTYVQCAEFENPVRNDTGEGRVSLHGTIDHFSCEMSIGAGANALILCASLSQNNKLSQGQAYTAAIEITDLLSFIQEVTIELEKRVNIESVFHGACVYHDKRIFNEIRSRALNNIIEQTSTGNSFDFSLLSQLVDEIGGNKVYFSKPIDKQEECEYRIVWLTGQNQIDPIIIQVPEAIKYCRPVYF